MSITESFNSSAREKRRSSILVNQTAEKVADQVTVSKPGQRSAREKRRSSILVNQTAEKVSDHVISVSEPGQTSSKETQLSSNRSSLTEYDESVSATVINLARARRRSTMSERRGRGPSLRVLLPEPARRKGPLLLLPYPSEIFPTDYNRRLPEWRWRAGYSAYNDHWRNETEYVLVAFACTVGLSNIVYFPMLALKYHHGSFLYAYVIVMFLIGFPFLFLNLALGQFTAKDAAWVYTLFPLARGVGISLMLYTLLQTLILTFKLSWFAYFIFSSLNIRFTPTFSWQLPWKDCQITQEMLDHQRKCNHVPQPILNTSSFHCVIVFFHDKVGALSGECELINGYGEHWQMDINWPLVGCVFFVVVCAFLITIRSIKSIGTTVLVVLPGTIVSMLIFTLMEIILSSEADVKQASADGIKYFFTPSLMVYRELQHFEIWFVATSHVINSLSLDTGAMIFIGSHARFQSSAHYHALYIVIADVILSILSGIIIYSLVGVLDYTSPANFDAIEFGMGPLTRDFILYMAIAIERLDNYAAPFMFVTFSFLFSLGILKLIVSVSVFLNPILEMFPNLKKFKWKLLTKAITALVLTILLIPVANTATLARFVFLTMFLDTPTEFVPLVLAVITASTFIYGYGLTRLRQDMDFMLHYYPNKIYCVVWYSAPVICTILIIGHIIEGRKFMKDREPTGIFKVALWIVVAVIFVPIFVVALWTVYDYYKKGVLRKIRRPLDTFAPRLHELPTDQRQPKESVHDSKLQRQEAITTLSSVAGSIRRKTVQGISSDHDGKFVFTQNVEP